MKTTLRTKYAHCTIITGLACLLAGTQTTPADILSEDFNSGILPATLEITGPNVAFGGGVAIFNGASYPGRSYLRTIADDFYGRSFVAQVTVSMGSDIAFFGMGNGAPNGSFFSEPALASMNLRIHPDSVESGKLNVADNSESFDAATVRTEYPGSGTHRLQLTWDATAKTAVFAIHQNYAGGAFVADYTAPAFNGADNGFTDSDTRVFFGSSAHNLWENSSPATFDNFTITSIPEPAGCLLLSMGFGVLVLSRRRQRA